MNAKRLISAGFVAALATTVLYAQTWDRVGGSMQTRGSTTAPLVIIDQVSTGKILSLRDNETEVWSVADGGAVTATGVMLAPDGAAGAPSYSFASVTNKGWYSASASTMDLAIGAVRVFTINATDVSLLSNSASINLGASSDVALSRGAANLLVLSPGNSLGFGTSPFVTNTAPTISSGFGTSPSVVASNGTAAFTINVGTGGTASTGVIGLPAATTGWAVQCMNTSTNTATVFLTKQTATTTTTATIGNYDAAGAAAAWVASNILVCSAVAY